MTHRKSATAQANSNRRAALLELAAELEQAERGSREVSDRVLLAWGWERNCVPGEVNWWTGPGQRQPSTYRPSPTESLDACEAAMPEGWELGFDPIFFDEPQRVEYDAILCRAHWEKWNPINDDWIERIEARGKTKPLAASSAICRALAAELEGDEKA